MAEPENTNDGISNYTPFEIKELLIEYAMRSHQDITMTTTLTIDDLSRASCFDVKELESLDSGVLYYTGPDLHMAMENRAYEEERMLFLRKIASLLSAREDLQPQIFEMLDEELKERGLAERADPDKARKLQAKKFLIVAAARIKAAMLSPGSHHPFHSPRDKYDFEVHLTTLRGGYAGTTQIQRLYFSFPPQNRDDSSYRDFLAQLQDATQLSVIPPHEAGGPYRASFGSMDQSNLDEETGTPINALGILLPTPPESSMAAPPAPPAPLVSQGHAKGYTINHGAWIYTSILHGSRVMNSKVGPEKNKKLTDKASYHNMIQVLRSQRGFAKDHQGIEQRVKWPPRSLVVHITHSMDAAALQRLAEEEEGEAAEEIRYCEELRAQGFLEEDIGEPFGAYLKKEIAMEKEKASRRQYADRIRAQHVVKLQSETQALQSQMYARYSPEFAQAPFEAAVGEREKALLAELAGKLKSIPRHTSGF